MDYEIDIAVPGSQAWCKAAYAAIDKWTEGLARSQEAAGLAIMPAYRLVFEGEFSELQLSFAGVPGEGAWQALERAASVVKLFAPDLLDAPAVRVLACKSETVETAPQGR